MSTGTDFSIEGPWPYTSIFKTPSGRALGRKVWDGKSKHVPGYRYFINKELR